MIEAGASKSFEVKTRGHVAEARLVNGPLVWLNLVCLDAPLVAISWQWLFARSFEIPIVRGGTVALFLTAWLIYLADRFGDSLSVAPHGPISLRQRFCLRHRGWWMVGIIGVAAVDLCVLVLQLERPVLQAGLVVGTVAVVYLLVNQRWPEAWRWLPIKEAVVGFLFAAGTIVGLAGSLTRAALAGWCLFAGLCALNCISIAVWERELDAAQGRVSIATVWSGVDRWLPRILFLSVLLACGQALINDKTMPIALSVGASAISLGGLHRWREWIAPDVRTAMADLALLTPLAWMFR